MEAERNGSEQAPRGPLEQTLLAALGWAALTVEGADDLADDFARRVGIDRDAARRAVRDALEAWRHEGSRLDARRSDIVDGLIARLGLVQKADVDDLALRVAQLEHRVRLLESE